MLKVNSWEARRVTKKQLAEFVKADLALQTWLRTIPGVVESCQMTACVENAWPIDCPEFTFATPENGRLRVYPASSHNTCFTVYCRWVDWTKQDHDRPNMDHWKWNHGDYDKTMTSEEWVEYVQRILAPYLPEPEAS